MSDTTDSLPLPFPIHHVAHNYYLYSTPLITALRARHNIPGTLIGTLPQFPQQNVFLGLPLLLSPSETRLLVQRQLAYIVDDTKEHRKGLAGLKEHERHDWIGFLRREGEDVSRRQLERVAGNREKVLDGMDKRKRENVLKKLGKQKVAKIDDAAIEKEVFSTEKQPGDTSEDNHDDEFLFSTTESASSQPPNPSKMDQSDTTPAPDLSRTGSTFKNDPIPPVTLGLSIIPHRITPTISYPPLRHSSPPLTTIPNSSTTTETATSSSSPTTTSNTHFSLVSPTPTTSTIYLSAPPKTPKSILHNYLSRNSYYLLPGLRFGCHFSAYPGDPLRFHSHFLCRGYAWEEEIDLMDLVGGGRLGTGVKKGFLVGGRVEGGEEGREGKGREDGSGVEEGEREEEDEEEEEEVRCFCIEWAGM